MKGTVFDFAAHDLKEPSVIESSAGTGKTYSIVQLYLRLIIEKNWMPEKILVVTFTEAATSELRSRIREALTKFHAHLSENKPGHFELLEGYDYHKYNRDDLVRAVSLSLASFDEASIFTIHGFCKRVLRDNAFEYSTIFNAELVDDTESITSVITRDYLRNLLYPADDRLIALVEKDLKYEPLMKLLKGYLPKNGARIIPDSGSKADVKKILKKYSKAYDQAAKIWKEQSGSLLKLITDTIESFKGNIFSREKILLSKIGWDEYFSAAENVDPPSHKYFDHFTPEKLLSSFKAGAADKELFTGHACAQALDGFISSYNEMREDVSEYIDILKSKYIDFARTELEKRKHIMNLWSFDDLIRNVRDGLMSEKGGVIAESVRKKYHAALIDEFQDTDPVQCDIFEKIFNPGNGIVSLLFYIGDPKQAIYSFRGADIYSYLRAKKGKGFYVKTDNHRSVPGIINSVNAVFDADDPFLFNQKIDYMKVSSKAAKGVCRIEDANDDFNLIFIDNPTDKLMSAGAAKQIIREHIADEMTRLFALADSDKAYIEKDGVKEKLVPGDCAVIVRDHAEASAVHAELRSRGIPSVLAKSGSVMMSPVKTWFDLFLRAVYERREGYIRAALSSPMFGFSASKIYQMTGSPESWENILELFRSLNSVWENRGFMPMFSMAENEFNILEKTAASEDGARNTADLLHIAEIYHRESISRSMGPSELIVWSAQEGDDSLSEEHRTRLETDDDAVKIITVHASKGLEYPVVFAACGWDSRALKDGEGIYYHDDHENIVCDLSADPADKDSAGTASAIVEQCSENLRLYYVALTRAAFRCYCYAGRISGYPESAAGYLFHGRNAALSGGDSGLFARYDSVAERVSAMTDDEVFREIHQVAANGPFSVQRISRISGSVESYRKKDQAAELSKAQESQRDIRDDWKISSFSYIVSSHSDSADPDYDEDILSPATVESEPEFPAGPSAGNCIHDIFEKIDFRMNDQRIMEIAEPVLKEYNLYSEQHAAWVCAMVRRVLSAEMPIAGISLDTLPPERVIKEMEFYFPAAEISADRFRDTILKHAGSGFNSSYVKNISLLDFERFAGFLRGFSDLVFEHDGKYYIADWKSNYIRGDFSAYDNERLCREMDKHLYTVQAVVYTLALHMHLSSRLPGYDYDKHFGGVVYVFLRGVNPGSQTGLWSWRPEKNLVTSMESLCIRRDNVGR